ncbi:MAG: hypothetical protein QXT53_02470 [Ignisphaera sp.]
MKDCSKDLISIAKSSGAPFTIEVVKSIARICNEDPYELWYEILGKAIVMNATPTTTVSTSEKKIAEGPCWRCEACGKTFSDARHLVNHITYFVRQRDKAHIELYQKIKKLESEKGKTFTEIALEILKCP